MTAPRPSEPRLPLVSDAEPGSELAEVFANTLMIDGKPINIFGMLAHHPKLFKRFNLFGALLLNKGVVPDREREIVILRVGWNAQSVYEFGQHTLIGREAGLTDVEIAAIAGVGDHEWSDDDAALIALADELCADDVVSDATWARLEARWPADALVELVVCAGFYRLVSGFLNTFGVPLDPGVPSWPTDNP